MITKSDLGYPKLGSQMSQYAAMHALSRETGHEFVLLREAMAAGRGVMVDKPFDLPNRILRLGDAQFVKYRIRESKEVDENLYRLDPAQNHDLLGEFHLYTYWDKYRDDLLALFTFRPEIRERAAAFIEGVRGGDSRELVSVHLRRGDYLLVSSLNLPMDYYDRALSSCIDMSNRKLVVFSDDIEYCRKAFAGRPYEVHFSEGNSNHVDMCAMALCDHNVIANSTFSWWAAYLNRNPGKIVVCPREYIGKSAPEYRFINGNYYPPSWIALPVEEDAPETSDDAVRQLNELLGAGRFDEAMPLIGRLLAGDGLDPALREKITHLKSLLEARQAEGDPSPSHSATDTPGPDAPPAQSAVPPPGGSGRMLVGAWNYYETLARDNFMFRSPDAGIGDNLLKPLNDLHAAAAAAGIDLATLDTLADPGAADAYLFFDIPSPGPLVDAAMRSGRPKYLVMFESEIIRPDEWAPAAHAPFDKVFTWNDQLASQGGKYVLLRWPYDFTEPFQAKPLAGRKLCTLIAGNKSAGDARELYSKRVEAIRWFERNHPESFDLYGPGWDGFPSWKGRVDSKREALGRYAFSICFENARGIDGWVTEKIFDCLAAGCVPVYLGAPNISDIVPADCFIDFNEFESMEALYDYLSTMDAARYAGYQAAIARFIGSGGAPGVSIADFCRTIVRELSTPEVSVVIPAYNYGRYLGIAIESVLAQGIPSFELVIVDNASEDGTREVAERYLGDPRVRYVRNESTLSANENWEKAVGLARGEFVAILSADDFYLKGHLDRLLRELKGHPECDVAYVPCLQVDEGGAPIRKATHPGHPAGSRRGGRDEFPELLASDCYVTPSAALIRRAALPRPVFDPALRGAIDWSLWVRLAMRKPDFVFLEEPTCAYRIHEKQDSKDFYASDHPLDDHLRILEAALASPEKKRLAGHGARIERLLEIRASQYDPEQLKPFSGRIKAVRRELEALDEGGGGAADAGSPLVSVIIPTYNRPDTLVAAVRSVLAQSYGNLEIIVVNDAGDDVEPFLRGLDPLGRVTYVRNGRNQERSRSRNNGLRMARGEYVAYLDDDDVFYPEHIEKLVSRLAETGARVAYSDACRAYQKKIDGRYVVVDRSVPYSEPFSAGRMLVCNYIPILCILHEKSLIDEIGGFDETLSTHEDWDLLIRMSRLGPFEHVPAVTAEFSWREDGTTTSSSRQADFLRTTQVVYSKYRYLATGIQEVLDAQARHLANLANRVLAASESAGPAREIRFSIILPVFNNLEYTRNCVTSIAANSGDAIPYELIVVDNGSTDGTAEFLAGLSGDVRILSNRHNLGFAKACNMGARAARGGYLLFLNNDTVVHPGWLDGLLRAFEEFDFDIVGAKLLYPDGTIQHAGVAFGAHCGPHHIFRGFPADLPAANKLREYHCVTGACMAVRKPLFDALCGFDEGYLNGFEDVDFCLRANEGGARIVYTPECVVTHFESKTPGRKSNESANARRLAARWGGRMPVDDEEVYAEAGFVMIPSEGGKVYLLDSNQPAFEAVERLDLSAFGIERLDGLPLEQVRRNIHVVAGKKLMAKKNHLGAAKHFRAAMSLGDHSVLSDLGDCLANEGQLEEAALCYAEALEDSPPSARAMVGLGVLRLMGGDGDAASGFFERALALEPANAQALCGMGLAANIAGKGDAAFDWFLKALDAAPSNQAAIHELVKGAYEQGRFAEAEARIRRFLEFEPSNAHLLFSLAGICHRQGKRADALDALDRLDLFSPEYDGAADLRTHVAS